MQTVFEIEGQRFNVVKKGYGQAKQIAELGRWLNTHGTPALKQLVNDEGELAAADNLSLIMALLNVLTPDALVELYQLVLGCERDFAIENFSIDVLVDALLAVWNNQPALQRIVNRFFSTTPSESTEADSSTPSE